MEISEKLAKTLFKGMQQQANRDTFHDVMIIVDGKEFKGHRFLLSAASDFFGALFKSGMTEDRENKVVLKIITSTVFQLIMDTIYFAKDILTVDNVSNIWHAASQLQIKHLLDECEIFQSSRISTENCIMIRLDSKFLSSEKLQQLSWDFITKHFCHLVKEDTILFLDFEDMKMLVSDDKLIVSSEEIVIDTILRWIDFNPNQHMLDDSQDAHVPVECQRKKFLFQLLKQSKLFLVTHDCLINLLENKYVLDDSNSIVLIREGLRFILQPGSHQKYCPLFAKHRLSSSLQNGVFIITNTSPMKYIFSTEDDKCFVLATGALFKCRAIVFENYIFWTNATGNDAKAFKYEINISKWTKVSPLTVAREDHALICLNNFIYAIGGKNCISIERFDFKAEQMLPGSGKWYEFGNLAKPMNYVQSCSCKNIIVIFGSQLEDDPYTCIQTFNSQSKSANIYTENLAGSARYLATFNHGEDVFLLQESGEVWKINLDKSIVKIDFHTRLWADPLKITGAVVTNQELLIFVDEIIPQMVMKWAVDNFDYFNLIKIIKRKGFCFLNIVILKKLLVKLES